MPEVKRSRKGGRTPATTSDTRARRKRRCRSKDMASRKKPRGRPVKSLASIAKEEMASRGATADDAENRAT
eukprot:gene16675-8115_t